jgi:hypothetical protein
VRSLRLKHSCRPALKKIAKVRRHFAEVRRHFAEVRRHFAEVRRHFADLKCDDLDLLFFADSFLRRGINGSLLSAGRVSLQGVWGLRLTWRER